MNSLAGKPCTVRDGTYVPSRTVQAVNGENMKKLGLTIIITSITLISTSFVAFSKPKVEVISKGGSNRYSTEKIAVPKQLSPSSGTGYTSLSGADLVNAARSVPVSTAKSGPESLLNLELLGTAIGSIKDPIAFIKDLDSERQGMFKLGNTIQKAKIVKIVKGEVTFEREGKQLVLKMSKRALAWSNTQEESSILSVEGDEIVVNKNGLLNEAGNIMNMVQSVKIKPYNEAGNVRGLQVENIPEDSIIAAAGIQNKDVVKSVNNQAIDSYQKALQVYSKVKNQKEIKVSVLRDGKLKQLNYRLK